MVALTQDKDQFDFTWWIAKDVFRGSGHFAGKMLVVNWGDKTPVIYTFGEEGALDGEWADGSATETLELVANAASLCRKAPIESRARMPTAAPIRGPSRSRGKARATI